DRSAVGDFAGRQLQAAQETDLSNGADSSSFRAARVGGIEDHYAVLDFGIGDGVVRADDAEAAVVEMRKLEGRRVLVVGMGLSGVAAVKLSRREGAFVRAVDEKQKGEIEGVTIEPQSEAAFRD